MASEVAQSFGEDARGLDVLSCACAEVHVRISGTPCDDDDKSESESDSASEGDIDNDETLTVAVEAQLVLEPTAMPTKAENSQNRRCQRTTRDQEQDQEAEPEEVDGGRTAASPSGHASGGLPAGAPGPPLQ